MNILELTAFTLNMVGKVVIFFNVQDTFQAAYICVLPKLISPPISNVQ